VVSCNRNKYKKVVLTIREISNADFFIIGGGGLWPFESKKQLALQKLYFRAAKIFHCERLFFGIEINNLKSQWGKDYWRFFVNNSKAVIARNEDTVKMLSSITEGNQGKLFVSSDVTFAFETAEEMEGVINPQFIPQPGYLLMALAMPWTNAEMNDEHYKSRFQKFVDQIVNVIKKELDCEGKYSSLVFLPFYGGSDIHLINSIISKLDSYPVKVIDNDYPIGYKRMLFKYAKHVMAMRYHSVLFSLFNATPFTAISYSGKTSNLMIENGLSDHMVEFGIRSNQFFYKEFDLNKEKLEEALEKGYDNADYHKQLQAISEQLKHQAQYGFSKLFEILDE